MAAVCAISSSRVVDLHGMSALEARAAVLCVLAMLQQEHRDAGGVGHDVTFITGRGRGSEGGEPVVRRQVARLLGQLGMAEPAGRLAANPGRIVVPRAVVTAALWERLALQRQRGQAGGRECGGSEGGEAQPSGGGATP